MNVRGRRIGAVALVVAAENLRLVFFILLTADATSFPIGPVGVAGQRPLLRGFGVVDVVFVGHWRAFLEELFR